MYIYRRNDLHGNIKYIMEILLEEYNIRLKMRQSMKKKLSNSIIYLFILLAQLISFISASCIFHQPNEWCAYY